MVFKNGIAYLQAGGGIVFDSVEEDEYVETLNKLQGNMRALEAAEGTYNKDTRSLSVHTVLSLAPTDFWLKTQQAQTQASQSA